MDGAALIDAERQRQIEVEGWTAEHDDEHDDEALPNAARWYEFVAHIQLGRRVRPDVPAWPWDQHWWKPSEDPVRNLVKAGALWQAEADRVGRLMDQPRRRVGDTSTPHLTGRQRWASVGRDNCARLIDERTGGSNGTS